MRGAITQQNNVASTDLRIDLGPRGTDLGIPKTLKVVISFEFWLVIQLYISEIQSPNFGPLATE